MTLKYVAFSIGCRYRPSDFPTNGRDRGWGGDVPLSFIRSCIGRLTLKMTLRLAQDAIQGDSRTSRALIEHAALNAGVVKNVTDGEVLGLVHVPYLWHCHGELVSPESLSRFYRCRPYAVRLPRSLYLVSFG